MPDQELAGSLLLESSPKIDPPSNPATPLSISRTDVGTKPPLMLARISMFGAGADNQQGAVTFSTTNSGTALAERMRIHTNGNVGIGTTSPQAKLDVAGVVRADSFVSSNMMRHRMYPDDPIVYQDIFDAKNAGAIRKLGNPAGYDEKSYSVNPWNDRRIISFGNNNEADGNGAEVIIPDGYTTVWLRVLGERWNAIKAYFTDGSGEQLGMWAGGYRSTNCSCPDGSLTDSYKDAHQWMPIPAGRSGRLALISKPNTSGGFWLSGLAFSKNPWAHAVQSAVSYHWILNGGDATEWANGWENWNTDSLTKITAKKNLLLRVPVIPSKRDKLLYLVEHNNNWNGCMHSGITVNKKPIERLLATYDNPFARHWNSKYFERYIAARIPADLIPVNAKFLDVVIDMSKQNDGIHVREIGTHDLDVPWS